MRTVVVFGLTALFLLFSGCGNELNIPEKEQINLSFLTFNASLSPDTVARHAERLKALPVELMNSGADVVCLQDVWQEEDEQKIAHQLQLIYPYRYYSVTDGGSKEPEPAPCKQEELMPIATCYLANCAETDTSNTVAVGMCLLQNCGTEISGIPQECLQCMTTQITSGGGADIQGIMTACTSEQKKEWANKGNNGLMLLSKYELKNTAFEAFDSYYMYRGAIKAQVIKPQFGTIEIYCTSLTRAIGEMPYQGTAGSWTAEQEAQATALISKPKAAGTSMRVIMGDLAAGSAFGRTIKAYNEAAYDLFYEAGYFDPYTEAEDVTCTLCSDNALAAAGQKSYVSSHILFSDLEGYFASAARMFDMATITYKDSKGGTAYTTLSPHYGVFVNLSLYPQE